jgi:DNA-directed RNA polymerase I subunit RPA1
MLLTQTAQVCLQVPTDGKPVRGLIQDHVIAAVLLTKRDTFLTREATCMLLSLGCASANRLRLMGNGSNPQQMHVPHNMTASGQRGVQTWPEEPVPLPPPAVLKPKPFWTGKQARVL